MTYTIDQLVQILHSGNHTLVVAKGAELRTFNERGVRALYDLYTTDREFLRGSIVADKVVGKAAAALMVLGGVSEMHTDVVSEPALVLLSASTMRYAYGTPVPNILNRAGTGWCPMEKLCRYSETPEECLTHISAFLS